MANQKKCSICGQNFTAKSSKAQKYCSMKCYHESRTVGMYFIECKQCGVVFETRHQTSVYCSKACFSESQNGKIHKRCKQCNVDFCVIPHFEHREFCSRKCRNEFEKNSAIKKANCIVCGNEFSYKYFWPKVTCSKECAAQTRRTRVEKECAHCGNTFEVEKHRRNIAKYCSKKCENESGRITRECAFCKAKFTTVANKKEQKCCSRKCANKLKGRTFIEQQVANWLTELGIEYIEQYKVNSFHCDFYLTIFNTVIETDGTYWHSIPKVIARDKRKNALLKSKGIKLIRLSEHDIRNNKKLCMSIINAIR